MFGVLNCSASNQPIIDWIHHSWIRLKTVMKLVFSYEFGTSVLYFLAITKQLWHWSPHCAGQNQNDYSKACMRKKQNFTMPCFFLIDPRRNRAGKKNGGKCKSSNPVPKHYWYIEPYSWSPVAHDILFMLDFSVFLLSRMIWYGIQIWNVIGWVLESVQAISAVALGDIVKLMSLFAATCSILMHVVSVSRLRC